MELTELDTAYSDNVEITVLVPEEKMEAAEREITEKTAGKTQVERQEKQHYGIADGTVVLL
jgi:putative IMPACT (imprinted ancient) family translation regulator